MTSAHHDQSAINYGERIKEARLWTNLTHRVCAGALNMKTADLRATEKGRPVGDPRTILASLMWPARLHGDSPPIPYACKIYVILTTLTLEKLDPEIREAWLSYFVDDMPPSDIAKREGCSPDTIYARLDAAKEALPRYIVEPPASRISAAKRLAKVVTKKGMPWFKGVVRLLSERPPGVDLRSPNCSPDEAADLETKTIAALNPYLRERLEQVLTPSNRDAIADLAGVTPDELDDIIADRSSALLLATPHGLKGLNITPARFWKIYDAIQRRLESGKPVTRPRGADGSEAVS
jgi:hypothetical protein